MLFAVVSRHYEKIIQYLTEEGFYLVKRKGPKMFFYTSEQYDVNQLFHFVKGLLHTRLSVVHIFEMYTLYRGMIDFTPYLSNETKDKQQYYNQTYKDLSDEEIEKWKKEMNI